MERLLLLGFGIIALSVGCSPAKDSTGAASDEIVGGLPDDGDPAVPMIMTRSIGQPDRWNICSGSLVSPTTVLTAAHCFDDTVLKSGGLVGAPYEHFVFFGSDATAIELHSFLDDPTNFTKAPWFGVERVEVHPSFDSTHYRNGHDLAVAFLVQPVLDVTPLPLDTNASASVGAEVRMVGFGHSDPASSAPTSAVKRQAETAVDSLTDRTIAVGDRSTLACHGDSGGPLLSQVDGVDTVVGVFSFIPTSNGTCEVDNVFYGRLDFSENLTWLTSVLGR